VIELTELPDGWTYSTISEITLPFVTVNPKSCPDKEFIYVDIGSIDNTSQTIKSPKTFLGIDAPSRARRLVKEGDILFSTVRTYLKNIARVPNELNGVLTSTGIAVLRAAQGINENYLFYVVSSDEFIRSMSSAMDGTLYPAVTDKDVSTAIIPLPPLNEQRRIVSTIEQLTDRSHKARAALEDVPKLIAQFRQSVLAAAFRGDLTADWREKNPDIEPASELLERIKIDRRKRWEEAELQQMRNQGNEPKNSNWKDKYKESILLSGVTFPQVPKEWNVITLDLIADAVDPQPSHRTPPEIENGIPYIGIGDIGKDELIDFEASRKVSQTILEEHNLRYQLRKGDFIFGKIGTLGKPFILPEPYSYALSANVILIQPRSEYVLDEWLFYFMKTPLVEKILVDNSRSTSQSAFGIKKIRMMPVLVPSIQEQKEILLAVKKTVSSLHSLELMYTENHANLQQLDRSILAKAFRGELVPQDPNDEPAAVLLERIRAEREQTSTPKQRGKTTRKNSSKQLSIDGIE
jgi:type I restriction enzyme, S subunit